MKTNKLKSLILKLVFLSVLAVTVFGQQDVPVEEYPTHPVVDVACYLGCMAVIGNDQLCRGFCSVN